MPLEPDACFPICHRCFERTDTSRPLEIDFRIKIVRSPFARVELPSHRIEVSDTSPAKVMPVNSILEAIAH